MWDNDGQEECCECGVTTPNRCHQRVLSGVLILEWPCGAIDVPGRAAAVAIRERDEVEEASGYRCVVASVVDVRADGDALCVVQPTASGKDLVTRPSARAIREGGAVAYVGDPSPYLTYIHVSRQGRCRVAQQDPLQLFIDAHQREALRRIKARDGIAESEQIRRAIDDWLKRKGELEAPRRGARTPRRG